MRQHVSIVSIQCENDGERVPVQETALAGSLLVQSLPSCAALPVPFCSTDVRAWHVVHTTPKRTFLDCVRALKV